jgi:HEAT repeat protein
LSALTTLSPRLDSNPQLIQPFLARLNDPDLSLRQAAIVSLGRIDTPQVTAALSKQLTSPDWRIRQTASISLGLNPSTDIIKPLSLALNDTHPLVRQSATLALGSKITQLPQISDLLTPKLNDSSPLVRQAAVSSLGNLNNPRIIEPLLPKLNDPAWGVRQAAVGALSGFDTPQVLNSLTPRLKDPSWEVRYTAARSLGGNIQKMPRLVESFKPLLKDSSPLVRQSAVMSLGKIEGIEITRSITPLLEDQDTAVRHAATLVLGEKINRYRQFLLDPFINLLTRESNLLIKEAAAASLKDLEVADELKLKQVRSLLKDIPVPDKTRSVLVEVPGVTGFLGLDPFVSSRQPGWSEDTLLVKYVRTTQEAVIKEFNWPGKLAPSPFYLLSHSLIR